MAIANDIAFYVGAVPDAYDEGQMFDDVEFIIEDVGALFNDVQQFEDDDDAVDFIDIPEEADNPKRLAEWVDANMGDGELDIVWINGSTPSTLYPLLNTSEDGSRIEEWLDDGNMIINTGDWLAWGNFETGTKVRNRNEAHRHIMDLDEDIIVKADDFLMSVTNEGKAFVPSLGDEVGTNRPVNVDAIEEPWEAALILASEENEFGEVLADPIALRNKDTDGYVVILNQAWGANSIDRGAATAELIKNWVFPEVIGSTDPLAPLNDGSLTGDVRVAYVHDVLGTWMGDSNLDGEFNSADFVNVFQAGEYEDGVAMNSSWATGDWNGDMEFDSSDFVAAFQDGGYEIGPRPAPAAAVPEPTGILLLSCGVCCALGQLRRRR
jgi:hypothetical protein